jgi:hypothetical protein
LDTLSLKKPQVLFGLECSLDITIWKCEDNSDTKPRLRIAVQRDFIGIVPMMALHRNFCFFSFPPIFHQRRKVSLALKVRFTLHQGTP